MQYLYLHGFASGLRSQKLNFFKQRFQSLGLTLHTPDLNQDDFEHLTLTRQIHQVEQLITQTAGAVTIIGSSFGGLTAAWLAERQPQVEKIMLLAPAFQLTEHLVPYLGAAQIEQWRQQGTLGIYHYSAEATLPLGYHFLEDMAHYSDQRLQTPTPTLILHGRRDETIPISASQAYAAPRPWVTLIEMDSDHTLGNVLPEVWAQMVAFLRLPPLSP